MKGLKLYLLLFIFLTATGCGRKYIEPVVPALPAETHTGKNTFGFNLDGQLWLPRSKGIDSGPALYSSPLLNGFAIGATRFNQYIDFNIQNVTAIGTYDLTLENAVVFVKDTTRYKCTQGSITVTYFDNGIISGVFAMKAQSKLGNTIAIDQGRFDLRF
jgi:hypothetical protein